MKHFFSLWIQSYKEWSHDKAPMLGAALAYYTAFALAPLLLVVISISGFFLGDDAARGSVFNGLKEFIGKDGAKAIELMIKGASDKTSGIIGTIIGVITLLLGASGIFGQLKTSLNQIWHVETKPNVGIFGLIQDRFLNLSMVGGICFLLLVSFISSAAVSTLSTTVSGFLPFTPILLEVINFILSLFITILLFTLMYRVLPDVKYSWNIAFIGGSVAGLLFTIGKTLIGLYIGQGAISSSFGAAASIITVLVWVYYSAQILFFGAEFTKVYAKHHDIEITPSSKARFTDSEAPKTTTSQNRLQAISPIIGFAISGFIMELFDKRKKDK